MKKYDFENNNMTPTRLNPDIEAEADEVIQQQIEEKIQDESYGEVPVYDKNKLDENLKKVGETPIMDEKTVLKDLLKGHMAPKNKIGYLKVASGILKYVWEDEPDYIYTVDPEHPLVIFPERYHHVILAGPVKFKVEFYEMNNSSATYDTDAPRPGEKFVK